MLSTWLKTMECLYFVRGYGRVSLSSFVAQQGGCTSDMFRITWTRENGTISLQDYHQAFLTCPVFQMELCILSVLNRSAWAATMRAEHLTAVAQGKAKSMGPWETIETNGNYSTYFPVEGSLPESPTSATRIMQARIRGKPFCDTWWAIEQYEKTGNVDLVFGTDVKRYNTRGFRAIMVALLDPFHNLYSRLLLASTMANLLERKDKGL